MEENKLTQFFGFNVEASSFPKFEENTRKQWVEYGTDNQYGEYLIDLMNNSSKHNSLIKKKVNMTVGNGWVKTPENELFVSNPNGKEDLNSIGFKNGYDLMVYGMYALAITWSNDKKTVARISYVDVSKVRIAKVLDDDSEMAKRQAEGVDFYFISADWGNTRKEKNKPELIQGFSEKYKNETTQLVVVQEYRPGTDFYTLPDYISSLNWILLDKEIANFHLSSTQNGFTPSMVINFREGIPTDEEMRSINRKMQETYAGTSNGSKVIITFSQDPTTTPEFIPVNLNASDERFLQLEDQIQQNIIVGHLATPLVAGVATAGKLGSSSEILEAEMVFQANVIDAKQTLIERTFNMLANINGSGNMELDGIKSVESIVEEDTELSVDNVIEDKVKKIIVENKQNEKDANK